MKIRCMTFSVASFSFAIVLNRLKSYIYKWGDWLKSTFVFTNNIWIRHLLEFMAYKQAHAIDSKWLIKMESLLGMLEKYVHYKRFPFNFSSADSFTNVQIHLKSHQFWRSFRNWQVSAVHLVDLTNKKHIFNWQEMENKNIHSCIFFRIEYSSFISG